MQRQKSNSILLAIFHLLVFVFPLIIKSEHHHEKENACHPITSNTSSVTKAAKDCAVCDYNFVVFFQSEPCLYSVVLSSIQIKSELVVSAEIADTFNQCASRAPPVC